MKKLMTLLVGLIVVGVFVAYMITFQVRFDEVALLTTFDRAVDPDPEAASDENSGSVFGRPGIYLKAPWPIQNVHTYSRKLQLLELDLAEMQTQDGHSVIIKTFLAWRIRDPIAFFRTLENAVKAEREQLRPMMGNMEGVISRYRFDELVNTDTDKLKLREVEAQCAEHLRQQMAISNTNFGIVIERVGIRRLMLPEDITEKVFERMRTTRQRMAQKLLSEGEAEAATIRAEAASARKSIMAFANRRASEIESRGEAEAAGYLAAFTEDEDFAIFLRSMEALGRFLSTKTTFILDANELEMLKLLHRAPSLTPAPPPQGD